MPYMLHPTEERANFFCVIRAWVLLVLFIFIFFYLSETSRKVPFRLMEQRNVEEAVTDAKMLSG